MSSSPPSPSPSSSDHRDIGTTSSNLYLVTFLATLFLLLFVSCAVVLRSYLLRRRYQRTLDLAFANGIVLAPRAQGSRKKRFGAKPKMYEIWLGENDDDDLKIYDKSPRWMADGKTWGDILPLTIQTVVVRRRVKDPSAHGTASSSTSPRVIRFSNPNPTQPRSRPQGALRLEIPHQSASPATASANNITNTNNNNNGNEDDDGIELVDTVEDDLLSAAVTQHSRRSSRVESQIIPGIPSSPTGNPNASGSARGWGFARFLTPSPSLPIAAANTGTTRTSPAIWQRLRRAYASPAAAEAGGELALVEAALALEATAGGAKDGNNTNTKLRFRTEMLQIGVLVEMPSEKKSGLYRAGDHQKFKSKSKSKSKFRSKSKSKSKSKSEINEFEDDESDSEESSSDESSVHQTGDDDDDEVGREKEGEETQLPELVMGVMRLNYRHGTSQEERRKEMADTTIKE